MPFPTPLYPPRPYEENDPKSLFGDQLMSQEQHALPSDDHIIHLCHCHILDTHGIGADLDFRQDLGASH